MPRPKKTLQVFPHVPTRGDTLVASTQDLLKQIEPADEGASTSTAPQLAPRVWALKVSSLILLIDSTTMLKRSNQRFAQHIVNYQVPDDPKSTSKNTHMAIRKYLKDGKLGGNQIKGGLQPLTRYRLLLQMGSILGYDVHDTTYGERVVYEDDISDRFKSILKDLNPWYGRARVISDAMESGKAMDDVPSIWRELETDSNMEVSAEATFKLNREMFASNISVLVGSIIDSQKALVHQVKCNLQVLAYMVHWHMTVSTKSCYLLLISSHVH